MPSKKCIVIILALIPLLIIIHVILFFYSNKLLLFSFHADVLFIRFRVSDYTVITPLGRGCCSAKVKDTHNLVRAGHG